MATVYTGLNTWSYACIRGDCFSCMQSVLRLMLTMKNKNIKNETRIGWFWAYEGMVIIVTWKIAWPDQEVTLDTKKYFKKYIYISQQVYGYCYIATPLLFSSSRWRKRRRAFTSSLLRCQTQLSQMPVCEESTVLVTLPKHRHQRLIKIPETITTSTPFVQHFTVALSFRQPERQFQPF